MVTKGFVQIEINAVFTRTSCKMRFRSGVFVHLKYLHNYNEAFLTLMLPYILLLFLSLLLKLQSGAEL
jgi:hypothetical protein